MKSLLVLLLTLLVSTCIVGATSCGGGDNKTTETECPISCSADSQGWEVAFECKEEGQSVKKTCYEGYTTKFEDGKMYVHGDVGFEFETSGNLYRITVDVEPCEESSTGYCIRIEATGDTLGSKPVGCQNY